MTRTLTVSLFTVAVTLSAVAFNTLMCFAGGVIGGWVMTKDPFWMMSGALAGIFAAASGLDAVSVNFLIP